MTKNLSKLKSELKTLEKVSESWVGKLFNKIYPNYFNRKIQSIQYQIDKTELL